MRNAHGRFMPRNPNPLSGGANPAAISPTMTHAVVIDLDGTHVLGLYTSLAAARTAAKASVFRSCARVVEV
jgi:hypothetical protein